jgi:hypothetical protein
MFELVFSFSMLASQAKYHTRQNDERVFTLLTFVLEFMGRLEYYPSTPFT